MLNGKSRIPFLSLTQMVFIFNAHKHGSLECYYPQKVPFYLLVKLFIERFESVKSELIYKYMYIISPPPPDSESLILIK